jgi:phage tail sheath gpL-like
MGSPVSQPIVNIQLLAAQTVDTFADRRALIVGQTGVGGTAVDKALVESVHNLPDSTIQALFGTDHLYGMINSYRSAVNVQGGGIIPQLDVISVAPNVSGVAATSVVTFTGPATADGILNFAIVDEDLYSFKVNVTDTDTPTIIGDAFVAAVTALTNAPFTAVNASGTVTITANDVGEIGNKYALKYSGQVGGVGVTLTGWTGGATNPTLTDSLDAIEGLRYTGITWPEGWEDDIEVPADLLSNRFNVSNGIEDGVVFLGRSDTAANQQTFVSTLNNQSLVVMGNNVIDSDTQKGSVIVQPADWGAAYFMGVRAKRLSTGAQIADLLINPKGLDATGGPSLASLAYHNTPLADMPVTLPADQYTSTEQIELRDAGVTVFGVNRAANFMIMSDVVTTRTTDNAGNDNNSFLYLNYVDTGSVCREIIFNTLKAAYPQSRLTEGDLIDRRSIENAASIKEQLLQIYAFLANLALVQAGDSATAFFRENTNVDVSLVDRLVTIDGPLPIVTQIGTINYNLSISFTIGASGLELTV